MIVQKIFIITITAANQQISTTRLNVDSFTVYARAANAASVRIAPYTYTDGAAVPFTPPALLTDSTALLIPQNQSRSMTNISASTNKGERYDLSKYVVNGTANDILEVIADIIVPGA